jgi:hypothetical protein
MRMVTCAETEMIKKEGLDARHPTIFLERLKKTTIVINQEGWLCIRSPNSASFESPSSRIPLDPVLSVTN